MRKTEDRRSKAKNFNVILHCFNAVNLKNGFSILEIRTQGEILKFDDYDG